MPYYIETKDGLVLPVDSVTEWIRYFESAEKVVAKDELVGAEVSTVFLGLDYNFSDDGPPILYETLVFGGPLDQEMERYCTRTEAVAGHEAMVARVRDAIAGAIEERTNQMERELTDISEDVSTTILHGHRDDALEYFVEYATAADSIIVTLSKDNAAAIARAEAAEAERDTHLRRLIESEAAQLPAALDTDMLREELAALRSQGWRAVTEEPQEFNWYLTYDESAEDLDNVGMQVNFFDSNWEYPCTHWQPLPPPPKDGE